MRSRLCFSIRAFPADRCLGQDCFPEVLGSALFCSGAGFGVRSALSWTLPSSLRYGFYLVRFLQGFLDICLESLCKGTVCDCKCNCDFHVVTFYRHVSDHVEIDYADSDLWVKNSAETVDN